MVNRDNYEISISKGLQITPISFAQHSSAPPCHVENGSKKRKREQDREKTKNNKQEIRNLTMMQQRGVRARDETMTEPEVLGKETGVLSCYVLCSCFLYLLFFLISLWIVFFVLLICSRFVLLSSLFPLFLSHSTCICFPLCPHTLFAVQTFDISSLIREDVLVPWIGNLHSLTLVFLLTWMSLCSLSFLTPQSLCTFMGLSLASAPVTSASSFVAISVHTYVHGTACMCGRQSGGHTVRVCLCVHCVCVCVSSESLVHCLISSILHCHDGHPSLSFLLSHPQGFHLKLHW